MAGAMKAAWAARASAIAPAVLLVLFMLSPVSVERSFMGMNRLRLYLKLYQMKRFSNINNVKPCRTVQTPYGWALWLCITAGQELTHQQGALFQGPLLRSVINVDDAEAALITKRPFEVVHQ